MLKTFDNILFHFTFTSCKNRRKVHQLYVENARLEGRRDVEGWEDERKRENERKKTNLKKEMEKNQFHFSSLSIFFFFSSHWKFSTFITFFCTWKLLANFLFDNFKRSFCGLWGKINRINQDNRIDFHNNSSFSLYMCIKMCNVALLKNRTS